MSDSIEQAITERIATLKDEIERLKATLQTYRSGNAHETSLTGKEKGDLIVEWLKTKTPGHEFTAAEVNHNVSVNDTRVGRLDNGIRYLLKYKIIKDLSPGKSRNKTYGLSAKGQALLFPDNAKVKPTTAIGAKPTTTLPKPKAKAKQQVKDMKKGVGRANDRQYAPGEKERTMLDFLKTNETFTWDSATKAMGSSKSATQEFFRRYNNQRPLYEELPGQKSRGEIKTFRSLIYDGPHTRPSSTPQPNDSNPNRESRVRAGEGVETGRLRSPYGGRTQA